MEKLKQERDAILKTIDQLENRQKVFLENKSTRSRGNVSVASSNEARC